MISERDEQLLLAAGAVVDGNSDMASTIGQLRDVLGVDHLVYHSSKLGSSPSLDPYIRLTYPAAWIKRYLQMGYVDVDPVLREGFLRTLPFDWSELTIGTAKEAALFADALAHGIGPHGLSVPLRAKSGHRGLLSMSSSLPDLEWDRFREANLSALVEIGNRIHRRVIRDAFGEDRPHLTDRELECLRWIAQGKDSGDIAAILKISPHTARDYLKSVRYKLDCATSAQALSKAIRIGLLTL